MWRLLEQAAKSATANASEYVSAAQEKAQSIVATVQDEAVTLLHALGTARTGPVDEILYEEIDDYKVFVDSFKIDAHTDEIAKVLETEEEMHDLHEQMVPVQLSYEEFWSRYFFRKHQEDEQKRREEERKQLQREQQVAKALELEALNYDDDLNIEDDGADLELKPAAPANNETPDATEEPESQLVREAREADKRAAIAWKKKAVELQKKLGALAAQREEEKQRIIEEKDMQFQNLCDSYEAKMTEVTMQIDDARAIGYDAGIQESESIIAAMRQAADEEIERLRKQLARSGDGDEQGEEGGDASVLQLREALLLKTQALETVSAEKIAVETLLLSKDEEIAALSAQLEKLNQLLAQNAKSGSPSPSGPVSGGETSEEAKKEIGLWRIRALKMKKAKELVEAEFLAFKETQLQLQQGGSGAAGADSQVLLGRIVELEKQRDILVAEAGVAFAKGVTEAEAKNQAEIEKLTQQLAEADSKIAEAFQKGVVAGKSELEAQLLQLQDEVERSYDAGYEAASLTSQKDIDLLRTEIAVLRAGNTEMTDSEAEPDVIWGDPVPVLGEEFSDTDAISNSIDNLNAAAGETWDTNASVSDDASDAPRDDWGEW